MAELLFLLRGTPFASLSCTEIAFLAGEFRVHVDLDVMCDAHPPMDGARLLHLTTYEDIGGALHLPKSQYFEALRLFTVMRRHVHSVTFIKLAIMFLTGM